MMICNNGNKVWRIYNLTTVNISIMLLFKPFSYTPSNEIPRIKRGIKRGLGCCHISPDNVNGRRTDRKSTKIVYPVVKVVSVAMKVVAECVRSE